MKTLMGDQDHIAENLFAYIQAFSPAVRDIFERFEFHTQIERLAKAKLLYLVTEKFANIDLHRKRSAMRKWGSYSKSSFASSLKSPTRPPGAFHAARSHQADGQPDLH